jgi:hypothetical protein
VFEPLWSGVPVYPWATVPAFSLDAPFPAPPVMPGASSTSTSSGDGEAGSSRGTSSSGGRSSGTSSGGGTSSGELRAKVVVLRKSSLKPSAPQEGGDPQQPQHALSFHAHFNLPASPKAAPATTAAAKYPSVGRAPQAYTTAAALNTRGQLVNAQLDITKWQKKRMEQGKNTGRGY